MRVQVNLSDDMVARVDIYAAKMGVSRSSLCSILVGQGIMAYDNSANVISNLGDKLSTIIADNDALKVALNEIYK